MEYYSLNKYLKEKFEGKVYKIALDGGFTCPNRDGKAGVGGCIFCSAEGSGNFAGNRNKSIKEQLDAGIEKIRSKLPKEGPHKFIAYFQAFTNTYGEIAYLKKIYEEAIFDERVVALSIATRPDCLPDEVIFLLDELNKIKPVWIELGLQTINPDTAMYIRRGYELSVYDDAVKRLLDKNIYVITHVILGLPGESKKDMVRTCKHVADSGVKGIKLQLLHVLKNTDLCKDYEAGKFQVMTLNEYIDTVIACLKVLPKDMVVHRITGDGDKKELVAPLWSADKKHVLNTMNKRIKNA